MTRNPPEVKKKIRETDGFVCAYPDCSVPYLEYHHFDPPWNVKEHNNPEGIIALCPTHHGLADGGVFTKEQLHTFKKSALTKCNELKGKLLWLRSKVVIVAGTNVFYDNTFEIMLHDNPMIWFNRDEQGNMLMNIDIPSAKEESKIIMKDNEWEISERPDDIECSPLGKKISIDFNDSEFLQLEFIDIENQADFLNQVKHFKNEFVAKLPFPFCLFLFKCNIPSIKFKCDLKEMQAGEVNLMGNVIHSSRIGLSF